MDSNEEYKTPLMGDDSGSSSSTLFLPREYEQPANKRWKWSSYMYIVLLAITILGPTLGLVWYSHYKETSPYALTFRGECGWSVAEAKANDCVFDVMMSSWLPKLCYDEELSDKYLAANNFTFWGHSKGTDQLSEEEVRKGEFNIIFTHATYHTQHCLYLWDKQLRAAKSRRPILDSITRSQSHIEHCLKILTEHTSPNFTMDGLFKTGTPIHVKPQNQICWEG